MFKLSALIGSPIHDVFENPGEVAQVIRVNGGKAPRSTMDQDVTSSQELTNMTYIFVLKLCLPHKEPHYLTPHSQG
jgi:hypothetical protein